MAVAGKRHWWDEAMVAFLREHYPVEGPTWVADKLGLTYIAVTVKARKLGVKDPNRCKKAAATRSRTSTSVRQDYFDTWSPEMAYVLGYTYADGALVYDERRAQLKYSCSAKDETLLSEIYRQLGATSKMARRPAKVSKAGRNNGEMVSFTVCCRHMAETLINSHGLKPRRTQSDHGLPYIPDQFLGHFTRGFLDGNGSINQSSINEYSWSVSLSGKKTFLTTLRDRLCDRLGLYRVKVKHTPPLLWEIGWGGKADLQSLHALLYPTPTTYPFLARKKNKFDLAIVPNPKHRPYPLDSRKERNTDTLMMGSLHDLPNVALFAQTITPDTYTSTATGTGVDMQLTEGPVTAVLSVKSHDRTDGDETLAVKLQESSDNSTFTDIAGATFTTVATNAAQIQAIKTDYRSKRYMRAVGTSAGTTPSTKYEVTFISRLTITGSGAGVTLAPLTA